MKFFADTADIDAIAALSEYGLIDGVTTNPSLIHKAGKDIRDITKQICSIVKGPVSAEVVSTHFVDMMREADSLSKIADNICIKLPLTLDGLKACQAISKDGRKTNVTLCFSANQAILAAKAGATYVSPFVGRLDDINIDGMDLIRSIRTIYDTYPDFQTEILAASVRTANHVTQAAITGADVVTAPPSVIQDLAQHPLTVSGLAQFTADWERTGQKI